MLGHQLLLDNIQVKETDKYLQKMGETPPLSISTYFPSFLSLYAHYE